MARDGNKQVQADVRPGQILVPWSIYARRPATANLDGDTDWKLSVDSTGYQRQVLLLTNGIVPDREGVDRLITMTHRFNRDEFAEFVRTLTEINQWILEPFEIPTTEEKN